LALAGGGLSLYTAWLGGKLVEEMGEGVNPMMEQMSRHEHHDGIGHDDRASGREDLDAASSLEHV